jgi:anti-anti-sigma factor
MNAVTFLNANDTLICEFRGSLDSMTTPQVEQALKEKLGAEKTARLVFDMAGVDYVNSTFLRVCLHTQKNWKAGSFQVVKLRPNVKSTFELAGLGAISS